jgi:hypothetical protein
MCKKHPEARGTVCGEFVCGMCYMDTLMATPVRMDRHPAPSDYVTKLDKFGHPKRVLVPLAEAMRMAA